MITFEELFWFKVAKGGENDCWEWRASLDSWGYGKTYRDRKTLCAHRVAYELAVGPIPDGLVLDHLCRNPKCVNPAHLEPVTTRENNLRGESPFAKKARQTHCVHGHVFDDANTYRGPNGRRSCRTCNRASVKRYEGRKKVAS